MANRHFGWRRSAPDARDRMYSAPQRVMAALPPVVDLSLPPVPHPFSPAFDQGELGSCGPQSAAADIVFAGLRQQSLARMPMPSRLFMYYCTRDLMGTVNEDSGVDNRSLLKALARFGWCDESLWPYDVRRFRQRPPAACYEQASQRRIVEYLAVPQNLNQMRGCLAAGDPFIFGFSVFRSMLTDEVERSGDIPMPKMFDAQEGGHDVLCVGYDDRTQRFKIRNSWGKWGRAGEGTIPYQYATNPQLAGDFWTVRHAAMQPIPTPVTEPTSMMKKILLGVITKILEAGSAYAATTPDPLDDMIIAMLKSFVEKLSVATNAAEVADAADHAKAVFNKLYPSA